MSDESEKLKRLIAASTRSKQDLVPFYVQQDIEPPIGGKSLLHDDKGRPLYKQTKQFVNRNAPIGEVKEAERVKIKGSLNIEPVVTSPLQQRGLNPLHTSSSSAPPQKRFEPVLNESLNESINEDEAPISKDRVLSVSDVLSREDYSQDNNAHINIGNHEDHGWYDEHVTGVPIDNNDYINTDALQGAQKLPQSEAEKKHLDEQRVQASWTQDNPPRPVISDVIKSLGQSEMCVLIKGDPVYISSDINKIIKCVEDAMLNFEIPISNISVIKKMELDFGLIMK